MDSFVIDGENRISGLKPCLFSRRTFEYPPHHHALFKGQAFFYHNSKPDLFARPGLRDPDKVCWRPGKSFHLVRESFSEPFETRRKNRGVGSTGPSEGSHGNSELIHNMAGSGEHDHLFVLALLSRQKVRDCLRHRVLPHALGLVEVLKSLTRSFVGTLEDLLDIRSMKGI